MVKPIPAPLDTMRAYRACLNCRNRKSKCDLGINQGKPPCRRCQRENKVCVLGESHRGGRRIRKKLRLEDIKNSCPSSPAVPYGLITYQNNSTDSSPHYSPLSIHSEDPNVHHDILGDNIYSWNQVSLLSDRSDNMCLRRLDGTNFTGHNQQVCPRKESTISLPPAKVHECITSADLENPSDALEILAQVADRADSKVVDGLSPAEGKDCPDLITENITSGIDNSWLYSPLQEDLISVSTIYSLFSNYEDLYYPYFPIIPKKSFDHAHLPWMSRNEPHLFSAILTVASRDNDALHQICYDHMQKLVSMILAGADANIEAVEALLILSQWVSRPQTNSSPVGRGEEDRVAWMYIGTALRLAYYIGLDSTSFKDNKIKDAVSNHRNQLVWAACYMCDRQVSIRVGKGFWTRGPDLLFELKPSNFPTLRLNSTNCDDNASIFRANLEITQIFSSVHSILYSSKDHSWKEMLEGRYTEYLDDFRIRIRNWNDNWGSLKCSPRIKVSLLLSYNYLRLYVNAFAYQATISRILAFKKEQIHEEDDSKGYPAPLINATAPDARFVYEALEAAKSLISVFNDIVDPKLLRYMPSTYYLFIVYSAVFLYKARITTTMTDEERQSIRTMIQNTIERLQKISNGSNHMGSRYARLLQLLWRKVSKRNVIDFNNTSASNSSIMSDTIPYQIRATLDPAEFPIHPTHQSTKLANFQSSNFASLENGLLMNGYNSYSSEGLIPNGFSWLDLGATCNFATQNNGGKSSPADSICDIGDEILKTPSLSPWALNNAFLGGWKIGEGEGGELIF
ncbi:putative zn2 cys6 dna-binding protein [Erysiphe neolycopersici]|uniref:Putative zn2 cys6 dna-binding protein n=1 Tax=Erysiphe neolycopersici TaxID=212602 RepID=A0A420HWC3_9PEZI|nr:putative zn2 cys6 dna-binding protein [Erysiphe neolycopersici]